MNLKAAFVRARAAQILKLARQRGSLQVRIHNGHLLTYPYPAKRGYGTRGYLIGIYTSDTQLEWIERDLMTLKVSLTVSLGT